MNIRKIILATLAISICFLDCTSKNNSENNIADTAGQLRHRHTDTGFFSKLADSAITLTNDKIVYDPTYFVIPYPGGDVPSGKGVCCDVIIRAYRKLGIDLQRKVHEDMQSNFEVYPHKWQLRSPDKNIDHRRVPNLMTFFERHHAALPVTNIAADYEPGDIVCWNLGKEITHIGIVVGLTSTDEQRNLIVHNIGGGQVVSDCLFKFTVIGHYRYRG